MSTDQYHERAIAAIAGRVAVPPDLVVVGRAGLRRAARVRGSATRSPRARATTPLVAFSAHSLPVRVVEPGTDYPGELAGAADAIARAAGVGDHVVCWQSAGRTGDAWLGPDVLELLGALEPSAVADVVVCPVGFVSDHLEVLYDLDVEAAAVARERGIALRRTASLNDDPAFCAILADVVEAAAA